MSTYSEEEIPDRRTADAAKWLSEQNAGLATPTFWLVAGLLAAFALAERKRVLEEAARVAEKLSDHAAKNLTSRRQTCNAIAQCIRDLMEGT